MPNADHPEYPSASAAACAAHSEALRLLYGTDEFGWEVPVKAGSSKIEPGLTPKNDVLLKFNTWTQFEEDCAISRLYGGIHFRDSIEVVVDIAHEIGRNAYHYVQSHINP
jgi:hypothetical protein